MNTPDAFTCKALLLQLRGQEKNWQTFFKSRRSSATYLCQRKSAAPVSGSQAGKRRKSLGRAWNPGGRQREFHVRISSGHRPVQSAVQSIRLRQAVAHRFVIRLFLNMRKLLRHESFTVYMATSAFRRRSSAVRPPSGKTEMPTLRVKLIFRPLILMG